MLKMTVTPKKKGELAKSTFWSVSYANSRPYSQAFLADTVETGDKNRHDFFHCMQMSLVMSMRFIFGGD